MNIETLKRGACLALVAAGLSACATQSIYDAPGDVKFGEYNRQTMMAQVIDPNPVYDEPAVSSGDHASNAIERYRTDNVKQPEGISTTDSVTGSSPN
ncbi:hypothetical protein [Altererythrobacter aquiaggeris]|uniref:hypothetical protein n=1 Tax=Aestuarierythrobacter aquiaggeris TaxID=1898396 RepID=UPI00301832B8